MLAHRLNIPSMTDGAGAMTLAQGDFPAISTAENAPSAQIGRIARLQQEAAPPSLRAKNNPSPVLSQNTWYRFSVSRLLSPARSAKSHRARNGTSTLRTTQRTAKAPSNSASSEHDSSAAMLLFSKRAQIGDRNDDERRPGRIGRLGEGDHRRLPTDLPARSTLASTKEPLQHVRNHILRAEHRAAVFVRYDDLPLVRGQDAQRIPPADVASPRAPPPA